MRLAWFSYLHYTVIAVVAVALLGLALLLAVGDPYGGPVLDGFRLGNLVAPLRTYLFRLAVANTFTLALGVGSGALILGAALARLGGWTARPAAVALLLTPWLLSDPLAGLLWRPLVAALDWTASAPAARLALGLVWLWRLAPLAALILAHSRGRPRYLLALAAVIGCLLIDAGTPLLLTGGEPFNAGHTWASWTLLQLWTSRAWAYAAVMAGGLGLVTASVMGVGVWAARRVVWQPAPQTGQGYALWVAALLWALPPWLMWFGVWWQRGPAGGLAIFVRAGGLGWLLTWLAVAGVAVMVAMLPAAAGLQRMRWRGPLIAAGMLPLLPVTLAYARVDHAWLGNPWLPALLLGALAGGFAWGLPGTTHARIRAAAGWVAVLMPHSFALWLVMDGSRRFYLLDQGVALVLGDAAVFPGALAVGLWIGGVLAWSAARGVVYLAIP